MDFNFSAYMTSLTMESLEIPSSNTIPAFIFGTLTYCVILIFNMSVLLTIALKRNLHKPMYVLLFNMHLSDMVGATAFFPQVISSILSQNRSITYTACFVQALLVHLCGTASFFTLSAMAYDRYIAICCPLRYNTLMSPKNLLKIVIIVWSLDIPIIGLLLALAYRKEICSTKIVDIFCNTPSLVKLICGDVRINSYYGLFTIVFIQAPPLLIVLFTYMCILYTVLSKRQSDAKSKAIQTCGTHLIVFLFFEFNVLFALVAHRLETASPSLRRAFGASVLIFPPILNPLIYGLKTKEIRQNLICLFRRKVSPIKRKTRLSRENKNQ